MICSKQCFHRLFEGSVLLYIDIIIYSLLYPILKVMVYKKQPSYGYINIQSVFISRIPRGLPLGQRKCIYKLQSKTLLLYHLVISIEI